MSFNPYEILGLSEDADLVQITAAFQRLLRNVQQGSDPNDPNVAAQTQRLTAAYELLSDSRKRKAYHAKLNQDKFPDLQDDTSPPQQNQAEGTPESNPFGSNGHGFATKTSTANRRRSGRSNSPSGWMMVVGIILGALTSIPIGLFLVWFISGFDPLGIFREHEGNQLVQEGSNLDESDAEDGKDADGSSDGETTTPEDSQEPPEKDSSKTDPNKNPESKPGKKPNAGTPENKTPDTKPPEKKSQEPAKKKAKPNVRVYAATFGVKKRRVDITDILNKILEKDPPVFINSAKGLGIADPAPKIRKSAGINFWRDGKRRFVQLKAGRSAKYNLLDELMK